MYVEGSQSTPDLVASPSEDDVDFLDDEDDEWPDEVWQDGKAQSRPTQDVLPERTPTTFYPSPPLRPDKRELRLLQVLPAASFEEPIQCILGIHSLDECPAYEALSYTWGFTTYGYSVTVNGYQKSVTDNLGSAIRRLRHHNGSRTLWIDALCINQLDLDERSQQVSLMRDIYKTARQVLVWLGDADEPLFHDTSLFPGRKTLDASKWALEDHQIRSFLAAVRSTASCWWERVWIIQEVVVADRDPMICFGRFTASWDELPALLYTLEETHRHGSPESFLKALGRIKEAKKLYAEGKANLRELSALTRGSHASEPKDYVYSLLGIAGPQETDLVQPDYAQGLWESFSRATYASIKTTDSFSILCHLRRELEGMMGRPDAHLRPSWAVDWREGLRSPIFWKAISTNLGIPCGVSLSADARLLRCTGRVIGRVCASRDVDRKENIDCITMLGIMLRKRKSTYHAEDASDAAAVASTAKSLFQDLEQRLRRAGLLHATRAALSEFLEYLNRDSGPPELWRARPDVTVHDWWSGVLHEYVHHTSRGPMKSEVERCFRSVSARQSESAGLPWNDDIPHRPPSRSPTEMVDVSEYKGAALIAIALTESCVPGAFLDHVSLLREANEWTSDLLASHAIFCTDAGYVGVCTGAVKPDDILVVLGTDARPLILGEGSDGTHTFSALVWAPILEYLDLGTFPVQRFTLE